MTEKFRMKSKPQKPKRKEVKEHIYEDIKELLYEKYRDEPGFIRIEQDWYDEYYAVFKEIDKDFAQRMDTWNWKIIEYNEWYKQNKEQIEEINKKKQEAKEKKAVKQISDLEKQIEKIKQSL